jgi:hypothetical protein
MKYGAVDSKLILFSNIFIPNFVPFYLETNLSKNIKGKLTQLRNRNRNRNKFINQIRAPGRNIQITIMIDTQQQYIKLNIRGEISIIVVQAHSGRKRDICT